MSTEISIIDADTKTWKSKDSFFYLLPFFLARMSLSHSNPLHGTVATERKQQSDYGESEWPFEEQARHANMMPNETSC